MYFCMLFRTIRELEYIHVHRHVSTGLCVCINISLCEYRMEIEK